MDISSLIRFFKKASTESLLSQYRVKLLQAMEFAYADMCGLLKLNRETKEQENRYTKQQLTELRKFIDNCVEDKNNQ